MNTHKARIVLAKDSEELLEWLRWAGDSAHNFETDLETVVKTLDTVDKLKLAGITKKQHADLQNIMVELACVRASTQKILKRMTPIARKFKEKP